MRERKRPDPEKAKRIADVDRVRARGVKEELGQHRACAAQVEERDGGVDRKAARTQTTPMMACRVIGGGQERVRDCQWYGTAVRDRAWLGK